MTSFKEYIQERVSALNELKVEMNLPFNHFLSSLKDNKKIESYSVTKSRIGYIGGIIHMKSAKSPAEVAKLLEVEGEKYFKSLKAKSVKISAKVKENPTGGFAYDVNWSAPIDKEY